MTTQLLWYGREIMPGEEIELPDNLALRYIATQQAERVEPPQPVVEAATLNHSRPNAMRDFKPQKRR